MSRTFPGGASFLGLRLRAGKSHLNLLRHEPADASLAPRFHLNVAFRHDRAQLLVLRVEIAPNRPGAALQPSFFGRIHRARALFQRRLDDAVLRVQNNDPPSRLDAATSLA